MRHLVWLSGVLLALSCTVNDGNLNVDASGAGGNAATGGQPGAGGTSATGGATASGGQTGTGGNGQTGGTTGAGGSVTGTGGSGAGGSTGTGGSGAGGSTGTGGSGAGGSATGTGGSGTGGKGGQGGHGGQGGESCDKLASDYASAMTAAKACTPGATNQCQTLVDGTVGCSGCRQYVNDATTLDQIQTQWDSQGCTQLCSAIACVTPPSTCTGTGPTPGGPGGGANPAGTCTGGLLTAAR